MPSFSVWNRVTNKTFTLDTDKYTFLCEAICDMVKYFNVPSTVKGNQFKFFSIVGINRSVKFNDTDRVSAIYDIVTENKIRHVEIFWPPTHGNQYTDTSFSNDVKGKVVTGYSREVDSRIGSGETIVGDPNGAHIIIPEGAIADGINTFSVKTIEVDSSNFSSVNNVTKGVVNDPDKVNESVN